MTEIQDFYESTEANQMAQEYLKEKQNSKNDWLFLICLFLTLYI